ncbi:MAG: prenyltransferase [Candidatus Marinimicrobia bacterium]|nr:prenyltransferase [Candidatus Neomarinimicrobiota bacterium]MCF7880285.1 prenyltransferase [Candidatus Neomarinimicrobiota bacterium]
MLSRWIAIFQGCNLPEGVTMDEVDFISRWLVITRACVFSMTLTSGIIGGLLALTAGAINWWYWLIAVIGLILAHASNNMINDYFDYRNGTDESEDYPRGLYSPHPIYSGWLSPTKLMNAILIVNFLDLVIAIYLAVQVGWEVFIFALAGLFVSVFYVAQPINLKKRGLGELGVFLIWGPLMIGGTFFVVSGYVPGWAFAASIPYGLTVTTVLIGKHIDKIKPDQDNGVHTLPVILGEAKALFLNKILFIAFHLIVIVLVLTDTLGFWVLISLLSLPRLVRETWPKYSEPRPTEKPEKYPVWPLWFVSWAFRYNRQAGGLFILGLILNLLLPIG